jgi:hypothetical protein
MRTEPRTTQPAHVATTHVKFVSTVIGRVPISRLFDASNALTVVLSSLSCTAQPHKKNGTSQTTHDDACDAAVAPHDTPSHVQGWASSQQGRRKTATELIPTDVEHPDKSNKHHHVTTNRAPRQEYGISPVDVWGRHAHSTHLWCLSGCSIKRCSPNGRRRRQM